MTQHERSKVLLPPMAMHAETTPCVVRGEGCYLYTEDGRKILDMASGIATNALGHCHPKVIAAAEKQLHTLIHAGHNILYYEPYTTLMEKLVEKTGNKYKVYFSNSGAEANEGAMKLAKYATQRPVIISMKNAFQRCLPQELRAHDAQRLLCRVSLSVPDSLQDGGRQVPQGVFHSV